LCPWHRAVRLTRTRWGLGMRSIRSLLRAAVIAAALLVVTPADAADTGSLVDGVFRYRADPTWSSSWFEATLSRPDAGSGRFVRVSKAFGAPIAAGPGCTASSKYAEHDVFMSQGPTSELSCALGADAVPSTLRYRLTLTPGDDQINVVGLQSRRGVVYSGGGSDEVAAEGRLYGGPGHDDLGGPALFGGPGHDRLSSDEDDTDNLVRGGPGSDTVFGWGGRVYGGAGHDSLVDLSDVAQVFFGGPGRDWVEMRGRDAVADIVRIRGGGLDRVSCDGGLDGTDVLIVDRSDRLGRNCPAARVRLAGRRRGS
jgi:hypothetical protein